MRPIIVGKTTYQVQKQRDDKGRPGKSLVAIDPTGEPVASAYTRWELQQAIEAARKT